MQAGNPVKQDSFLLACIICIKRRKKLYNIVRILQFERRAKCCMNIYDIAEAAGLSPATVSRVINNKSNVKESTRLKVMEIIEGKQYQPNAAARNLSTGASRNIAFLVPDIENSFFATLLHGISDCAYENHYNVFMYGTGENVEQEHQILENLQAEMIRGIIITPVDENSKKTAEYLKNFEKNGTPVVLVDRDILKYKFDGVFSNDTEGAYQAVRYLIKNGHKKIGIIHGPKSSKPGAARLEGYKRAMMETFGAVKEDYIVNGKFYEKESYKAMEKLMTLAEPPTAIFACNNLSTLGCLRYMKQHGMKLNRDVAFVGFDDIKEIAYTDTCLNVVARPIYEMGYEAMKILKYRFEEKNDPAKSRIIRRNVVDTWMVCRDGNVLEDEKEDAITLPG